MHMPYVKLPLPLVIILIHQHFHPGSRIYNLHIREIFLEMRMDVMAVVDAGEMEINTTQ